MQIKKGQLRVVNGILYFYNTDDGHHYTKSYDEWILYPTHTNGTLDYDCMLYLEDVLDELDTEAGRDRIAFADACDDFLEVYNRPLLITILQAENNILELDE